MGYFKYLNPMVKLIYYIALVVGINMTMHPAVQVGAIIILYIANRASDKNAKQNYTYFVYFTILMVVINLIFNQRGSVILFYVFDVPIMLEGVLYAVISSMMIVSTVMVFSLMSKCMKDSEIMVLFSKRFPKTAILINVTINFVRLLTNRANEITTILKTKNIDISNGSFKKRISDGMQILNVIVSFSLENSVVTAQSMSARAYGHTQRSSVLAYKFYLRDGVFLGICILSLACIFIASGYAKFEIYPKLNIYGDFTIMYLLYSILFLMQFYPQRRVLVDKIK